jgi:hypothetical protein
MKDRNLDWTKLLGFDQSSPNEVDLRGTDKVERIQLCLADGVKVGRKSITRLGGESAG